jgi:glycine betaine/proline transport system permease protein
LRLAGFPIAAFALLSQMFILVNGLWVPAMESIYMALSAVLICIVLGVPIGIAAGKFSWISHITDPINDTLQTLPQFVILIPAIMLFLVGPFTALIAICIYAIVPAIRYTAHGIRTVDPSKIEVARSVGCTARQILLYVEIPLALPEIILGINQVVMFALSMLVIAALVGTNDLGQVIYTALTNADTGLGLTAGLSMAFVAMVADRVIRGGLARSQAA